MSDDPVRSFVASLPDGEITVSGTLDADYLLRVGDVITARGLLSADGNYRVVERTAFNTWRVERVSS